MAAPQFKPGDRVRIVSYIDDVENCDAYPYVGKIGTVIKQLTHEWLMGAMYLVELTSDKTVWCHGYELTLENV